MNQTEHGELYLRHFQRRSKFFADLSDIVYVDARGCMCVDDAWAVDDRIIYLFT